MAAIGGNVGTTQTTELGATSIPPGHMSAQDLAGGSALVALGKLGQSWNHLMGKPTDGK